MHVTHHVELVIRAHPRRRLEISLLPLRRILVGLGRRLLHVQHVVARGRRIIVPLRAVRREGCLRGVLRLRRIVLLLIIRAVRV